MTLTFADGHAEKYDVLVGADGIDSLVRRTLWGDSPKREHNLHIFGGFTFDDTLDAEPGRCIVSHSRTIQGSWTSIRHKGRNGYQWWVLTAHDADTGVRRRPPPDRHRARRAVRPPAAAPDRRHPPGNVQRWVLRDRKPLKQWSKGRPPSSATPPTPPRPTPPTAPAWPPRTATSSAAGSPASTSPTTPPSPSPRDFEAPRRPHTARQSQTAYFLGKLFHHSPRPLPAVRDPVFDHTPFLQKVIGESTPGEILKQLDEIDETEKRFRQTIS